MHARSGPPAPLCGTSARPYRQHTTHPRAAAPQMSVLLTFNILQDVGQQIDSIAIKQVTSTVSGCTANSVVSPTVYAISPAFVGGSTTATVQVILAIPQVWGSARPLSSQALLPYNETPPTPSPASTFLQWSLPIFFLVRSIYWPHVTHGYSLC